MRIWRLTIGGYFAAAVGLTACVGEDPAPSTAADAGPASDAGTGGAADSGGTDGGGATDASDAALPVCDASPCVVQISAGGAHTCAKLLDGTLRCWGYNGFGESAGGTIVADAGADEKVEPTRYTAPHAVPGVVDTKVVGAGGSYRASGVSCVGTTTNTMQCWGIDSWGQLGRGGSVTTGETLPRAARPIPAAVVTISNVSDISVGVNHTCAVFTGGAVACWGSDETYQLGIDNGGVVKRHPSPETLAISQPLARVVARGHHNLALTTSGKVWGWGSNADGQLAAPASAGLAPAELGSLGGVYTDIAVGRTFSCALDSTGKVWCWGRGLGGQLGRGDASLVTSDPTPGVVSFPPGVIVKQIAGDEQHMVALVDDGKVYQWGRLVTSAGTRVGVAPSEVEKVPTEVTGLPKRATAVAAGFEHACALIEGGEVWCWGNNEDGELGRGDVDGGRGVLMIPGAVTF